MKMNQLVLMVTLMQSTLTYGQSLPIEVKYQSKQRQGLTKAALLASTCGQNIQASVLAIKSDPKVQTLMANLVELAQSKNMSITVDLNVDVNEKFIQAEVKKDPGYSYQTGGEPIREPVCVSVRRGDRKCLRYENQTVAYNPIRSNWVEGETTTTEKTFPSLISTSLEDTRLDLLARITENLAPLREKAHAEWGEALGRREAIEKQIAAHKLAQKEQEKMSREKAFEALTFNEKVKYHLGIGNVDLKQNISASENTKLAEFQINLDKFAMDIRRSAKIVDAIQEVMDLKTQVLKLTKTKMVTNYNGRPIVGMFIETAPNNCGIDQEDMVQYLGDVYSQLSKAEADKDGDFFKSLNRVNQILEKIKALEKDLKVKIL